MTKIVVVMPDMDLGGITTSVINFCNELAEKGNEVHFLNMNKGQRHFGKFSDCVKILQLDRKKDIWNLNWARIRSTTIFCRFKLYPVAIIKKILNKRNKWLDLVFRNYQLTEVYDIAVAFRQCSPCYYFVLNCIEAKKKVAFIHGNIKSMGSLQSFEGYFPLFDRINCVSKACCYGFKNKYHHIADKFAVVYNMFPDKKIKELSAQQPEISIRKDCFSIVTVSRIENATKGTDRILPICLKLLEQGFSFAWYVLGDGPDLRNNINEVNAAGIDNNLFYCGSIANPHSIVRNCNLSVLPTRGEAYSMTVIESQIVGTPIIVTRYEGVEEAVIDSKNGIIVEQDIDSITNALALCINTNNGVLRKIEQNLKEIEFNNTLAYNQFFSVIEQ